MGLNQTWAKMKVCCLGFTPLLRLCLALVPREGQCGVGIFKGGLMASELLSCLPLRTLLIVDKHYANINSRTLLWKLQFCLTLLFPALIPATGGLPALPTRQVLIFHLYKHEHLWLHTEAGSSASLWSPGFSVSDLATSLGACSSLLWCSQSPFPGPSAWGLGYLSDPWGFVSELHGTGQWRKLLFIFHLQIVSIWVKSSRTIKPNHPHLLGNFACNLHIGYKNLTNYYISLGKPFWVPSAGLTNEGL